MKQTILITLLLALAGCSFAQSNRLAAYTSLQANITTYDRTRSNNAGGPGLGLQTFYGTSRLRGVLEINGDLFTGTKELLRGPDDRPVYGKSGVLGVYAGPALQLSPSFFVSATGGTSWFHETAHWGVRPSVGALLSPKKTWMVKASFTHVFLPPYFGYGDFGYASLAVGVRLF